MLTRKLSAFAPLAEDDARMLILGSMPGIVSLAANEYYAHPQNSFWRIMATTLGFDAKSSYAERVGTLLRNRIAVWDVLAACKREGSLDSAIVRESESANDFAEFFSAHPNVGYVFFNGATAEALFKRHHRSLYRDREFRFVRLPSTSPAHAALRYEEKLAMWRTALIAAIQISK